MYDTGIRERKGDICKMSKKNQGFTLAELLVAVSTIAALVAIAIPVFSAQLEKSREAVDLANVRNAYAEAMTAAITEDTGSPYFQADGSYLTEVPLKQTRDGWTTEMDNVVIGGAAYTDDVHWLHAPRAKSSCNVYFKEDAVYLNWGDAGKGPAAAPEKQTYINLISAKDFLTKDILTQILSESYSYTVVNSNEALEQEGGTKKFLDYAAEKGFDLAADYGAAIWQIYVKEPQTGAILEHPAIYWSSIEIDSDTNGKNIPVMGYQDGMYDVYMAPVTQYNTGTDKQYDSIKNNFANITNGNNGLGGTATFQFSTHEAALAAYEKALKVYETNGTLTAADMKDLGLNK